MLTKDHSSNIIEEIYYTNQEEMNIDDEIGKWKMLYHLIPHNSIQVFGNGILSPRYFDMNRVWDGTIGLDT